MPRSQKHAVFLVTLAIGVASCSGGGTTSSPAPVTPGEPEPPPAAPPPPERPPSPIVDYGARVDHASIDATSAKPWISSAWSALSWPQSFLDLLLIRPLANASGETIFEETEMGPEGGRAIRRGVLRGQLASTSTTGWIWTEFEDFGANGWVIHGRVVQDVIQPITIGSHSIVLELTDLQVTRAGVTTVYHGSVHDVLVNEATGYRRTTTNRLLRRDPLTGETIWASDLTTQRVRSFLFSSDETYSGRLYDAAKGYVDVSSDSPYVFISNEALPDRGGAMRLTGANGSTGVVPLNPHYAAVVLDADGDGTDERFARTTFEEIVSAGRAAPDTHAPAVANAGARRIVDVGEAVTLDGLLSHDGDGSFLTAEWTLAVKPLGSTAILDASKPLTPTFTPDVAGTYTFVLEAKDPDGNAHDSMQVLAEQNSSWNLGVRMRMDRPGEAPLGIPIVLDASMSRREDLTNSAPLNVLYRWSLDAPRGSNAALTSLSAATTSMIPDVPGFYRITVDNDVPSANHAARASKIVGFDTGLQFHESAYMAIDGGLFGDPVLADLNADGAFDVASLGGSPGTAQWTIRLFEGDGTGALAAAAQFPIDNTIEQLVHGDLDGDGLDELVSLGDNTLFAAYLAAPLSASTLETIPLARDPSCGFASSLWAAAADSDGDGRAELLVSDRCRHEVVTWRHSNGKLEIVRAQAIPELIGAPIAFGDLNGDGRLDFVLPREPATPRQALLVFVQQPGGDFAQAEALEATASNAFAIGDVTGDGRGDLVVVRQGQPIVSVFAQSVSGELMAAVDYAVERIAAIAPRFADLDGDGRTDLLAVQDRGNVAVGLQQPNGMLAFLTLPDDAEQPHDTAVVPGDLDGDGRIDLLRRRQSLGDSGFSVRLQMP